MDELLKKIQDHAGITEEQAGKALEAVKAFVVEQFPMMSGAVENLFGQSSSGGEDENGL